MFSVWTALSLAQWLTLRLIRMIRLFGARSRALPRKPRVCCCPPVLWTSWLFSMLRLETIVSGLAVRLLDMKFLLSG